MAKGWLSPWAIYNPDTGKFEMADAGCPTYTFPDVSGTLARAEDVDFFAKFRDITSWVSLDGFTTTIDAGGSMSADGHDLYFATGNVIGNKACLYAKCGLYRLVQTGKKTVVEFVLFTITVAVTDCEARLHISNGTAAPPSETAKHFGFKILNGDLYASNADGTTQKITDTGVNIAAGTQHTPLRVEVNEGVNVKFYVDGELKVTHTENLPTVEIDYRINCSLVTSANLNKYMRIGRVAFERER
jgi:hypothetical protein